MTRLLAVFAVVAALFDARPAAAESVDETVKWISTVEPAAHIMDVSQDGALVSMTAMDMGGYAALRLECGQPKWPLRVSTKECYLLMESSHSDALARRLAALAHKLVERDPGSPNPADAAVYPSSEEHLPLIVAGIFALLAVIVGFARRGKVKPSFRAPLLLQVAAQSSIFIYWSIYFPGVRDRVPEILEQLVLAFATDALVMLARDREWQISFGPFPIVLSSNLFGWFYPPGATVVIVVAVMSRGLIRRGNRPIFNPSGIGLTVAGLLSLFSDTFTFDGVFHLLNMAPNMSEVIMLLSLMPQIRFRIVLITIGAFCGLSGIQNFVHGPGVAIPGTLIALALFATDPSTSPKSPIGQLLFGTMFGVGIALISTIMLKHGVRDDLSKVFPVPIANLLVPVFDRIGNRGARIAKGLMLEPRWNTAHVLIWLWLFTGALVKDKSPSFETGLQWSYDTPLIMRGAEDLPTCTNNPVFCRPFSFPSEAVLWWHRWRSS